MSGDHPEEWLMSQEAPKNPLLFVGFTLRDLFALAALVTTQARGGLVNKVEIGNYCYKVADLMLYGRARNERTP